MDPLDYAMGQSMGLFSSALRVGAVILRIAIKLLPIVLMFLIIMIGCCVSGSLLFMVGFVGCLVDGLKPEKRNFLQNRTALEFAEDISNDLKRRILRSQAYRRFFGAVPDKRLIHPGDDINPNNQINYMSLFIPSEWMQKGFRLWGSFAQGFLEAGLYIGMLFVAGFAMFLKTSNKGDRKND